MKYLKERLRAIVNKNPYLWDIKHKIVDPIRAFNYNQKPSWLFCPQEVQIDTHNYCSSTHEPDAEGTLVQKYPGCVFCNVKAGGSYKIPRGRMDDKMLKFIIDYWAARKYMGVEYIVPYINGDPIIENRLPWINQYCMEKGLKVCLDTSANVYRNRDYLVHQNLTLIRFSISAITPETYLKVQGCPKFKEAIDTFHYVANNKHPSQQLELHFMVNQYNEHELEEYIEYFKDYKIKIFPIHEMPGIQLNSTASLPKNEKWRIKSDTLKKWKESRPLFIYPNGRQERSVMMKSKMCQGSCYAVQWDGQIMHCTDAPPKYSYGHVYKVDMLEAWHTRNKARFTNPACIACNMKRPDWKESLMKHGR